MLNRRGLLRGIFAAGMAPAIVSAGVLMPTRRISSKQATVELYLGRRPTYDLATLKDEWKVWRVAVHDDLLDTARYDGQLVLNTFGDQRLLPHPRGDMIKFRRYAPHA